VYYVLPHSAKRPLLNSWEWYQFRSPQACRLERASPGGIKPSVPAGQDGLNGLLSRIADPRF
jgi:hypothetical protein